MRQDFTIQNSSHGVVWYISKYLTPPTDGGIGSRGFYLMRELSRLGHKTVIISSDSNHFVIPPVFSGTFFHDKYEGVDWIWIKSLKYKSVRSFKRILSWLYFEYGCLRMPLRDLPKPDVIVASSLALTTIISGFILSRRLGARLIFEVRDIWPLTLTEEGGFRPGNPFVKILALIERFGYMHSDAIVGTMPNLENHVRVVSKSTKPVYCVPMGYLQDDNAPIKHLPQTYLSANIPSTKFLIGYAGSIGTTNALDTLFESAKLLIDNEKIHFVIMGTGDLLNDYKLQYGALPNLSFVGKVARNEVQSVLSRFDALYLSTFPSKVWEYGQSLNKLIDYMLSGKPVIASYSGFPSMLNEAGSGIFVPAGDSSSLARVILAMQEMPPQDLKVMGKLGREWLLKNRSYEMLAKKYEQYLFTDTKFVINKES